MPYRASRTIEKHDGEECCILHSLISSSTQSVIAWELGFSIIMQLSKQLLFSATTNTLNILSKLIRERKKETKNKEANGGQEDCV